MRKTWRFVARYATSIKALTWRRLIAKPVRCTACFTLVATKWSDHFELRGGEIVARSAIGRVSVRLLRLNRLERIKEREMMIQAGLLSF